MYEPVICRFGKGGANGKENRNAALWSSLLGLAAVFFGLLIILCGTPSYGQAQKAAIDLNTASEKELESIKGVGPATAKKIIVGRPYKSVDDLSKAVFRQKQWKG